MTLQPRKTSLAVDRLLADLAEKQHGVFSRAQAMQVGVHRQSIQARLTIGMLEPRHRGVYAVAGHTPTFTSQVWAAYLACGPGAVVRGRTAARIWRLDGGGAKSKGSTETMDTSIEIAVPESHSLHIAGVSTKRTGIQRKHRYRWNGVPVTSPLRTLVDLAGLVSVQDLEDALDTALRQRQVAVPTIRRQLETMERRGVAGIGRLAELVEGRLDGQHRSKSVLERKALHVLEAGGLPSPVCQLRVRTPNGTLRYLDLAYPSFMLSIELDSWRWHAQKTDWSADRTRNAMLTAMGWRILQITWHDLTTRPDWVVQLIAHALGHC